MSKSESLNFGVRSIDGRTAASWYVAAGDDSSFYVGCRGLGGDFKLSFHASGDCNYSITENSHKNFEPGDAPKSRYIEWWQRPDEKDGVTHVCSIIVPPAGVIGTGPLDPTVHWVLVAQPGRVTEFVVLASWPTIVADDPAKCVVGSLALPNGQSVFVLFQEVTFEMPTTPHEGQARFFTGGKKKLESDAPGQLGLIACCVRETDRLRILIDTITDITNKPSS